MAFLNFIKDIFFSKPYVICLVSFLFFLAGILELLSLAMILPVLGELFDSSETSGLAGLITKHLGVTQPSMGTALLFIALFMSLRGTIMLTADLVMSKVARDLEVEARSDIFSALVKAKWEFIQSQDLGKLPNLILRETEKYSVAIQKLGQFLSSFLIASVLIISSLFASWKLAILFIIAIIPYLILVRVLNKKVTFHASKRIIEANSVSAQTSENLMHMKYIKSSALYGHVKNKFRKSVTAYAHHFFWVMCYVRFIKNFPEIFGVIIISILVYYAYSEMGMQSADIIFFLLLMFRGYRQVSGVQTVLSSVIENIPSYGTCKHFLAECRQNTEVASESDHGWDNQISLSTENVTYFYSDRKTPALKNINLNFPEKGMVVFTGQSGAGKTTLIDILLGLIIPQQGEVNINANTKLSQIPLEKWKAHVGYVPQEPFLISGTIRENILLHADDKSEENLINASKLSNAHAFIEKIPEAYEANLGFINTGLSGGQKQRIAIARSLAKNPSILILDEATSALDPKTERDICDVIKEISKTKLVIMIAHSIEMIKQADVLHFMQNGEIIETGTFEELNLKSQSFKTHISSE